MISKSQFKILLAAALTVLAIFVLMSWWGHSDRAGTRFFSNPRPLEAGSPSSSPPELNSITTASQGVATFTARHGSISMPIVVNQSQESPASKAARKQFHATQLASNINANWGQRQQLGKGGDAGSPPEHEPLTPEEFLDLYAIPNATLRNSVGMEVFYDAELVARFSGPNDAVRLPDSVQPFRLRRVTRG